MTPKDFQPYNIVFYYFTKWKREGVFEDIMDTLREMLRVSLGREESPSLGIMGSKGAKTSQHVDKERGVDGNKKVKGRKDQIVVDTLGLPMAVSIHGRTYITTRGRNWLWPDSPTSSQGIGRYLSTAVTKATS